MGENVKHTPGPWAISGRTATCIRTADQEQRIAYLETADNTFETCEANARLIAAAPDLLAALKTLSASIFVPNTDQSPELSIAIRMTIDAIAKAEGRP